MEQALTKKQPFFVQDRAFYATVFSITVPIALQNVISFGVNIMDTVMLGSLGDVAISGASLGGQVFFILMLFGFGLSSGGGMLIAQYWGKKDTDSIRRVMSISMRLAFAASLLFTFVSLAFPVQLMRLFSNEEAVVQSSADYLRTVAYSYVFFELSSNYITSLRSVEKVRVSAAIYGVSFFVNVFFNYCFIFGNFGFPRMGVAGAAVGTIIARASEFLMALVYMLFFERRVRFMPRDLLKFDRALFRRYVHYALPVVGNELLWGLGISLTNLIIGHVGSSFVTANSIASVMNQLCGVFTFGIASSAAVLTGKAVGEGKRDYAQQIAQTLLVMSFAFGAAACCVLLCLRGPVMSIYSVSEETQKILKPILTILAFMQITVSADIVTIVGILRGGGDAKTAFRYDCGGLWLISVPLGALTGLVLHCPVPLVYFCLKLESPYKVTRGAIRIFSRRWIRDVTVE